MSLRPRDVVVEALLGRGNFGAVVRATSRMGSIAIKVLLTPTPLADSREYLALRAMGSSCQSILQLLVCWESINGSMRQHHFCFPLAEMTLHQYQRRARRLGVVSARAPAMVRSLFEAVAYVHSKGWIHRDIKPDNVLLVGSPLRVLLADFGCAVPANRSHKNIFVGAACYRAPELHLGAPYSFGVDVFSAALVAAEFASDALVDQEFPLISLKALMGPAPRGLVARIAHSQVAAVVGARLESTCQAVPFRPFACDAVPALAALVHRALVWDPDARPTARQMLFDGYLT